VSQNPTPDLLAPRCALTATGIGLAGDKCSTPWNTYGAGQPVFASSVSRAIVIGRATASSPP
jgi:hypothetical protein